MHIDAGDTAWMLTCSALVLLMTLPGLALFYGGMVRKMNVLAILMQSFTIACLVAVLWVVVGYSLSFGDGSPFLGGLSRAFLADVKPDSIHPLAPTIPESVFILFQMTFAIITPALITGAIADRMKFNALLVFATLWSLFVYAPIAHCIWHPAGFLYRAGILDFAGGTVVHINAGTAGLVAALMLGKRRGYPQEHFPPHNLVLSMTGAALLWVGWFGFNAGSAAAANGRAGLAALTTMVAAAVAGLAWMTAEWSTRGKPSLLGILSGAVAGLVAITPASGFTGVAGALAIGLVAGLVCFWSATSLKHRFGYDDSLDCFGVHGIGGIVGALLTGVFANQAVGGTPGLLEGNPYQMLVQLYGVAATIIYSGAGSFVALTVAKYCVGLRVNRDIEREGLDVALHGEAMP
ncbi:MAG TPA: ammonium transporter [Dongiaceae bacterium]|jgi:Amt family ammonium transporter|nr:ammonium transporter [Dongiaceae bacterium]